MSRNRTRILAGLFLLALGLLVTVAEAARPRAGGRWEMLGEKRVSDAADHDALAVSRARGTFRAVQVRVLDRAVQFRDMKIHFTNGETQDVGLREVIQAGGQSRVIDVEGHDRGIQSIELRYDAQSLGGKPARVRVFGKN